MIGTMDLDQEAFVYSNVFTSTTKLHRSIWI